MASSLAVSVAPAATGARPPLQGGSRQLFARPVRQQQLAAAAAAPRRRQQQQPQRPARLATTAAAAAEAPVKAGGAPTDIEYDAIIIGSGMGGLSTAAQMAAKGAKVVVLEKYLIPGGSAAHFERQGFKFDVGSSMMFGFGDSGTTNLMMRALASVGKRLETVPDPTQIHYHLPASKAHPQGWQVKVWRDYERFIADLTALFPHEREGIRKLYDEFWKARGPCLRALVDRNTCLPMGTVVSMHRFPDPIAWSHLTNQPPRAAQVFNLLNTLEIKSLRRPTCWSSDHPIVLGLFTPAFCLQVFNALNTLELKSLEEPRYLLEQFAAHPLACLTLASFVATNTGDCARRWIQDPELLRFVDLECFLWSTVNADLTPMINAGMVFCDRHYGGINYPIGGVGAIPEAMAEGIQELGSYIEYKANVKEILVEGSGEEARAVGVRLADGRVFRGKTVVSNATRWDTFEGMIGEDKLPESERLFRQRYKKAPSFLSIHMGIKADALAPGSECHQIIVEDWDKMEDPYGTLFVSIPSLLDPSICPEGTHVFHAFTPDWIDNWSGLERPEYERKKEEVADAIVARLEKVFPGLKEATILREVGTPRTHRRFLNRTDGSYGPIPARRPLGMLSMPFNRTAVKGLYCVGDSTFPGQGVNAVVFSGFGCAHRVLCDLGKQPTIPLLDEGYNAMLAAVRDRS
ncbi:hypothetical protein ABPG75_002821 [Micractinium tetrahymenae]